MQGDYLVVQGVPDTARFFVTFGFFGYHLNKRFTFYKTREKIIFVHVNFKK